MNGALERFVERLAALRLDQEPEAPEERRAAVAVILRFAGLEPEVLLIRRVEHPEDPWSGQISLPGGHVDEGDVDLIATAMREAHEEVGIDLERSGRLLGRLGRVQARARGRIVPMGITPFVFACPDDVEPVAGHEAEEVFWFPLRRAASGELSGVHAYDEKGRVFELPCWRFEGRVIWGLTHQMLSALLRATF